MDLGEEEDLFRCVSSEERFEDESSLVKVPCLTRGGLLEALVEVALDCLEEEQYLEELALEEQVLLPADE